MAVRRLRVFAGPNGSGKSTIFDVVKEKIKCRCFINADEIFKLLSSKGKLNFTDYMVYVSTDDFGDALLSSSFAPKIKHLSEIANSCAVEENVLIVPTEYVDSYFAAFIADFLRYRMLNIVEQFTIETVLSDSRKIDYIKAAKDMGYRIYLYYVATRDVEINIQRIKQRVQTGGHDVPEDKTRNRYEKSLSNIYELLKVCDRAYFFDNSYQTWTMLAEYEQGLLKPCEQYVPAWFNDYVMKYFVAKDQ